MENNGILSELSKGCLVPSSVRCVAQVWSDGESYLDYGRTPRSQTSILFICSDVIFTYRQIGGETLVGSRNDFFFLPKGASYTVNFTKKGETLETDSYILDFAFLDENKELICPVDKITKLGIHSNSMTVTLLRDLVAACHDLLGDKFKKLSIFYRIMCNVSDSVQRVDANYYAIHRGVEQMRRDWNTRRKISYYSELCGISESHFRILFKRWAGMSAVDYRNQLCVSHAKTYLEETAISIEEIAAVLGFDDAFYFSRLFKKHTGMSPSSYRKHYRSSLKSNTETIGINI